MARSRRGFSQGHIRTRRQTAWGIGPGGSSPASISSSSVVILGGGSVPLVEGLTIVRLRGSFQAYLKTSDAANGGFHCALGIGLATDEAFGIGTTALPSPISDSEFDGWMYHRWFDIHSFGATIAESMTSGLATIQFEVDSKAMRKQPVGLVLYTVLEVVELSTATMSAFFDSRILAKLP